LILSGGGLLSQLTEQCGIASLFNITYDHKLGCLEKNAATQLIIDGLTKVGTISEDAVDYLLTITAGHPYYLQLLCSSLYEHAQEEKIAITREASASLVHRWVSAADVSRFHHLWEATDIISTQRNKLILSAIAHIGTTQSEIEYSRLAALVYPLVQEQDLVRALADLSDLGVLKHNRLNYAIEVELFACWLRQHSPFELVSKEVRFL
jgi:branched-chain amino acid transport system substrate-binding protein